MLLESVFVYLFKLDITQEVNIELPIAQEVNIELPIAQEVNIELTIWTARMTCLINKTSLY